MNSEEIDYTSPVFLRGCRKTPNPQERGTEVYCNSCAKFSTSDWLSDVPVADNKPLFDCVEVRFKSNRKDFFRLPADGDILIGDIVAVEASPGHDIGIVSLDGETARLQMKLKGVDPQREELKKVYRRARPADIEKWLQSIGNENKAIANTRRISGDLNLAMKINDVEYQGDGTKAVFYYTADDRVDFRELIKLLAEQFRIRIEMKQIGIRQEASRVGGLGSCGRELCCATWINKFQTVSTGAARVQQLSLNPQKLAGQCGKLKCCLNYEYDAYMDAIKDFPSSDINLKTRKGEASYQKTDVFKGIMWYSYLNEPNVFMAIPVEKVKEIIALNKKNKFPEKLEEFAKAEVKKTFFEPVIGQDDLRRFD
jgi:cell fate regulator YaaT (PSP1 superfamily)